MEVGLTTVEEDIGDQFDDGANPAEDEASAARAAAGSAQLPRMGMGAKAVEARSTATYWLNNYLGSDASTSHHNTY